MQAELGPCAACWLRRLPSHRPTDRILAPTPRNGVFPRFSISRKNRFVWQNKKIDSPRATTYGGPHATSPAEPWAPRGARQHHAPSGPAAARRRRRACVAGYFGAPARLAVSARRSRRRRAPTTPRGSRARRVLCMFCLFSPPARACPRRNRRRKASCRVLTSTLAGYFGKPAGVCPRRPGVVGSAGFNVYFVSFSWYITVGRRQIEDCYSYDTGTKYDRSHSSSRCLLQRSFPHCFGSDFVI